MTPFPSLVLPDGNLGPRSRKPQAASVAEAIRWPKGGSSSQTFTRLFTFRDYGVGVRKPGKEAELDPPKRNENDMLPTVVKTGSVVEYAPGFITIFEELQKLGVGRNTLALELIGCLMFRSAFMLDHAELEPGCWRYVPPEDVIDEIETWAPTAGGLGRPAHNPVVRHALT